jgi:hypothetical protein
MASFLATAVLAVSLLVRVPPAAAVTGPVDPAAAVSLVGAAPDGCPAGYECEAFTVECAAPYEAVAGRSGRLAIGAPTAEHRGTVMLFTGRLGTAYWAGTPERRALLDDLRASGLETIEVAWDEPWADGTAGYAAVSCRPAAVVAWGADRWAASGVVPPVEPGVCGFCIAGTSAGASQVAYPLTFHGLAPQVDAVVAMSGPAMSDLQAGCRTLGTPVSFLPPEESTGREQVDSAWDDGANTAGPCESQRRAGSFVEPWDANSLAVAGEHLFPTTRVHFLWGAKDPTGAVGQGMLYLAALSKAGTPMLDFDCIGAGHDVGTTPAGLAALHDALLWQPADGFGHAAPFPEPSIAPACVKDPPLSRQPPASAMWRTTAE